MKVKFRLVDMITVGLICLITLNVCQAISEPTRNYQYSRVIVDPDVVRMYWDYQIMSGSSSASRLDIEIHVKNSDWMIFCLNYPTSSSQSSLLNDCVVSGLSNETGIGHFSDRFLNNQESSQSNLLTGILIKDDQRDFDPLNVFYDDSFLIYKFTRPIKRCDESGQDLDIESGIASISFAYGTDGMQIATNDNITISNSNVYFNTANSQVAALIQRASLELVQSSDGAMISQLPCPVKDTELAFGSNATAVYKNALELVPGIYKFFWNTTDTELIGEVHCRSNGWVGFGLTPSGEMEHSDVFIGWIQNGLTNFTDRYITESKQLEIDSQQDWKLISSSESNGFTMFKFKRLLKTCDPKDIDIDIKSARLIYAWGSSDQLGYHGFNQRGVHDVLLIDNEPDNPEETMPADVEKLVFRLENVIIPTVDTYYYNQVFKIPTMNEKHHIIKWQINFTKFNYESMHHLVYYECEKYDGSPSIPPGDSTTSNIYDRYCSTPSFAWAVGAKQYGVYPINTGVPIGGQDIDYTYLRIELHYDNPSLKFGYIDKVDVIYYITKQLRQYDLGTLVTGSTVNEIGITIPPGESEFTITSNCYNSCLRSKLNGQNINVIMAFPHTHLAGLAVSTSLIRNGKDIGYVFKHDHYRFDFQQTYTLSKPVVITQDDEFITKCLYQTKDRTKYTYGGLSTHEEMCIHYFTYYPRISNFPGCFSQPSSEEAYNLLVNLNRTGDANMTYNANTYAMMQAGFRSLNPQSENAKNAIRNFNLNHKNNDICGNNFNAIVREPIKPSNVYVEPDNCTAKPPSIVTTIITFIKNIFSSIWNFFWRN